MNDKVRKVFEALGVEPYEEFYLRNGKYDTNSTEKYRISEELALEFYSRDSWFNASGSVLDIIRDRYMINKIIEPTKTEQLAIDYAKAIGCKWLAKDEDGSIFAYTAKPIKGDCDKWKVDESYFMINIPISFISWEDEEPYYIGE